ncbi:NAD-dependent epimerase/dehydratase family protein [Deinococcus ruber]|uniref:TDP-glucose-4,6-dehydratase n=1 Tax=Deinococcus ruber TaxID=1848197 RepID=A0A918CNC5_9DEIO|nr:NAD(P)-dependent oxidoreductase [Deinococcus ruber]GGR30081.1 TDP-glucose-4,6-dehydratase [Deinococcus ruber]
MNERHRTRVLLTGAAGEIGSALREQLRDHYDFILSDMRDIPDLRGDETFRQADLRDPEQVRRAMQGAQAVIHLGGIPDEHTYDMIRAVNMDGTQHVLAAAHELGVRRVAFASSIHTVGYYPRTEQVGPQMPVRPDTYYGVSKVFGEALGRMYFERYGLEFVAVRICSFQQVPRDARHLSTWLSPRDAAQLFRRSLDAEQVGFLTVAGISGNTRRWMTPEGWDVLGYVPQDDAERYATTLEHVHGDPASRSERFQGGIFTEADYLGRAQPSADQS